MDVLLDSTRIFEVHVELDPISTRCVFALACARARASRMYIVHKRTFPGAKFPGHREKNQSEADTFLNAPSCTFFFFLFFF